MASAVTLLGLQLSVILVIKYSMDYSGDLSCDWISNTACFHVMTLALFKGNVNKYKKIRKVRN